MTLETVFTAANAFAMIGWLALAVAPLAPVWSERIAGLAVPAILALAYAAIIAVGIAGGGSGEGGGDFNSLAGVMALFRSPMAALAGWLHYLAFDLLVGAWIVRAARAAGMPHWKALICLPPTLFLGPIGFLLFLALRAAHRRPAA